MRRNLKVDDGRNPSANFYKQYSVNTEKSDSKYSKPKNGVSTVERISSYFQHLSLSFGDLLLIIQTIMNTILFYIYRLQTVLKLQFPEKNNIDTVQYCIDCGKTFDPFRLWKRDCSNCGNIFCGECLAFRHDLHNGIDHKGKLQQVCSYCFFQLCARHCEAKCCNSLRITELLRFLSRKDISTRGALEKADLIERIRNWAIELSHSEHMELFQNDV